MRLLIVEDEVKMAGLLRRGLQEEGYAVDIAQTGSEAIWAGTENPYDVIVLDVMLPDLDGFEVCRRLREAGRWAPISCSPRATRCRTGSPGWMPAPTTT